MFYGYDPTYILVIIGAILSMIASSFVQSTYSKYSRVQSRTGMTGAQAAQRILQMSGISDVRIEHVSGKLTDHYDPSQKVVRLSDSVYGSTSVAAIGVAAHECHQEERIRAKPGFFTWVFLFLQVRSSGTAHFPVSCMDKEGFSCKTGTTMFCG